MLSKPSVLKTHRKNLDLKCPSHVEIGCEEMDQPEALKHELLNSLVEAHDASPSAFPPNIEPVKSGGCSKIHVITIALDWTHRSVRIHEEAVTEFPAEVNPGFFVFQNTYVSNLASEPAWWEVFFCNYLGNLLRDLKDILWANWSPQYFKSNCNSYFYSCLRDTNLVPHNVPVN